MIIAWTAKVQVKTIATENRSVLPVAVVARLMYAKTAYNHGLVADYQKVAWMQFAYVLELLDKAPYGAT